MQHGALYVGTSGYQYDHWKRVLYPEDQPKKHWFETYTGHFDTVEINNTFYILPKPGTFDDWRNAAPPAFRYALKFSRYGTHMKKLKDPQQPIEQFRTVAERLKTHLGPILVQLPPNWQVNAQRLAKFLRAAPRRHRWAVELRDPSWFCEDVYAVLRDHHAALCIHDLLPEHPRRLTTDWTYLRFHGPGENTKYTEKYTPQALSAWADRLAALIKEGKDVYAYFNNDAHGHAVGNARDLRRYVTTRLS